MTMKTDKYKVSAELIADINEWRDKVNLFVDIRDLSLAGELPGSIYAWWMDGHVSDKEVNNRLIALIRYVNGEDVFEVEKPKKWVVKSHNVDLGSYSYLTLYDRSGNRLREYSIKTHSMLITNDKCYATKFPSKEEADKWTNPLMEVVEVEDD